MKMRFEELDREKLALIVEMQKTIFPESAYEKGYELLLKEGPAAIGCVMQTYYIAYAGEEAVGITGLYIPNGVEEHHSIWLGWFGILPEYRGQGYGKQLLEDSMEKARAFIGQYPIKYFRLYTSEEINASAQPLYNSMMALKEYYRHEEIMDEEALKQTRESMPGATDEECMKAMGTAVAIFSKALSENEILVPWDNYFMNLNKIMSLETDTRAQKEV